MRTTAKTALSWRQGNHNLFQEPVKKNAGKSEAIIEEGLEAWAPRTTQTHLLQQNFYGFEKKNCATLHTINPRGYRQICVGRLLYMENRSEFSSVISNKKSLRRARVRSTLQNYKIVIRICTPD